MSPRVPLHRRQFMRRTALGLVALPLIDLEALAAQPALRRSRVAVVRTADRKRGVSEALRLLDLAAVRDRRVVLKPNFNSADEAPGSTHNDTLAQLVTELHQRGARSITVGESSGPPRTRSVMEQKGTFDLARDLRFDVVDFEQLPEQEWLPMASAHWPDGFHVPRLVAQSEYTVATCCLKTHGFGGVFTMSLKLAVGITPKPIRREMHRSRDMRRMIAELNTAYTPQLVVLDGVTAFTDGGPSQGELKHAQVMIAGADRIAVDAVGLAVLKEVGSNDAIMSRGIFAQEQIARAVELGLGAASPAQIELVTGDADSRAYAAKLRPILDLG